MVHFNQLTITPDAKTLIIDVEVLSEDYYDNVYIDNIVIDTQDTYTGTGISSKAFSVFQSTEEDNKKYVKLNVTPNEIGEKNFNQLLFIYVSVKGTPAADTPCGMDNITTMATVSNMYPFYQQAMNYIKELGDDCNISQSFIDYILKFKGLELAVKTGNYPTAVKLYKKLFINKGITTIKGGCGCGNH